MSSCCSIAAGWHGELTPLEPHDAGKATPRAGAGNDDSEDEDMPILSRRRKRKNPVVASAVAPRAAQLLRRVSPNDPLRVCAPKDGFVQIEVEEQERVHGRISWRGVWRLAARLPVTQLNQNTAHRTHEWRARVVPALGGSLGLSLQLIPPEGTLWEWHLGMPLEPGTY